MNKHRLRLLQNNGLKSIHKSNIDNCLSHLSIAHKYLSEHLKGRNEMGLLTNILNSSYEIKKNLK